jgi:membrane protein implicated in regulation of membrane protease activity
MLSFFRSATRFWRLFHFLIVAVALVWITNSVGSSLQSVLPYILVALIAWDLTRVLTVRHRRQNRDRNKRSQANRSDEPAS